MQRGLNPFESLENRRLLSVVNVTDYGATPNDQLSDQKAIQAAINDSSDGDTIYFPAGTYSVRSSLRLRGNRNYSGAGDRTILAGNASNHIFKISQDNIRIEHFTFDGKPIFLDKPGNQMVENIVINDNTFHVNAKGDNYNGITFTTGLRNSRITNNTFDPINGDNGIYGYYWDKLTISANEFIDGNEGIHLVDHNDRSRGLRMEQNYFSGLRRMGIELQGGGSGTLVQDNYYENPVMSEDRNANGATFAYSIIADESSGTIIRRNTSIAPQRPDGIGVRIIFEVGGDGTLVEENYSVGGNHVLASNDGVGSTSVLARNNRWSGYLQGASGRELTLENNGDDADLTWNVNRGKPERNKWLSTDGVAKSAGTSYTQSITPTTAGDGSETYLSDLKYTAATNGWGAVELDQSVGGKDSNDGEVLSIGGRTFRKGLGVAIDSEVVYNLNSRYSKLFSDIGVDDSVGDDGSVTFEVYADGRKIFESGVVRGSDAARSLSLNVSGVSELKLVTTNGGDGDRDDRADWGGVRVA
jgi:hypothetical protein